MKQNERTALALVRSGRSFDEAAESAGIPVARVMEIWGGLPISRLAELGENPAWVDWSA